MLVYDFSPDRLPSDLLQAIGLTIACAAQTEEILNEAIGGCLGVDGEYTIGVTAHMTLPQKFHVLYAVAEIRIDDLDALDQLDEVLGSVEKAMGIRNGVAHDSFAVHPHTGKAHRVKQKARGTVEVEVHPVDIDEITVWCEVDP